MHNSKVFFLFMLLAFLMAACTTAGPYRSITSPLDTETADSCKFTDGVGGDEACSLQHHYYETHTLPNKENDYYLAFIEFDDQGWFNQDEETGRKQMNHLLSFLYGNEDTRDKEYLIIVFAHGWRHNASPCDENVACFKRTLERLALMERSSGDQRTVVGVYVGWRGLSVSTKPLAGLELTSFWERKNTANRVGHGGVTELLTRLNDFREYKHEKIKQSKIGDVKTHLIITGHSFGGQVIYSALSQLFIQRAGDAKEFQDGELTYGPAQSVGDLVVLLNPAFEGSKYEPLYDVARNRCYPESQKPAMLVITSKEDKATKTAFWFGRLVSNILEQSQSDSQKKTILNAVGHLERYKTHDLCIKDIAGGECAPYQGHDKLEAKTCECRWLQNTPKNMSSIVDEVTNYITPGTEHLSLESAQNYGDRIWLLPSKNYTNRNPFLVISTDGHLSQGHNEIYGEKFTNFLRRFYLRHIYVPTRFEDNNDKATTCIAPLQ